MCLAYLYQSFILSRANIVDQLSVFLQFVAQVV